MELIKSYLPNQDKDYFLNKLSHITLAPLGHHDKSPHLIKRKSNFQGSQLVQWNYRTAIHFSTFLLLIPYNLSLYSQKTSSTISVPAFSSMVFDFTLLSGKTIRPAGFASAGYASERIQACGFEQSWVSIAGRFYYPWEYSWAAVGGGGARRRAPLGEEKFVNNNDRVPWDNKRYNRVSRCPMPLRWSLWYSQFF